MPSEQTLIGQVRQYPRLYALIVAYLAGMFVSVGVGREVVLWAWGGGVSDPLFGYWVGLILGGLWVLGFIRSERLLRRWYDE